MKSLKFKLIGTLILVFLLLSIIFSILQMELINRLVIKASNERIRLNMRSGWFYLSEKITKLEMLSNFLESIVNKQVKLDDDLKSQIEKLAQPYINQGNLDWLWIDTTSSLNPQTSKLLEDILNNNIANSGYLKLTKTIIHAPHFISLYGREIPNLTDSPLAIFAARKIIFHNDEKIYLFLGIWLDNANYIVDQIQNIVFEEKFYKGKRVGTVTIFNNDLRVATTVLLPGEKRAIGTRVSLPVKEKTLNRGEVWIGRAKVLDDWYLACYEPIKDYTGKIVGMLYMGELEKVSKDIRFNTILITIIIILFIMVFAFLIRLRQTTILLRRIRNLEYSAKEFTKGNFSVRVLEDKEGDELSELATVFNIMMETVEKDRAKLLEQQKVIEETNNNYLEMLGFITHELRNTLGSALFNLISIKEGAYGEISDTVKEGLSIVEDSLDYLKDITNNYLQLSRLEHGELYVEKKEVNLRKDVLEPIIFELRKALESKNVKIINEVPENIILPADPNLMRVVYENLIGNAVKYGRENGNIKLTAQRKNGTIVLTVWNDGEPIDQSILPTLFHKFRRYDTKSAGSRKGSGLGLFIVKRIVEIHGGKVSVESRPDKGTSFIIELPLS